MVEQSNTQLNSTKRASACGKRYVTNSATWTAPSMLTTTRKSAAMANAYGIARTLTQDGYEQEEGRQMPLKLNSYTERFLGFDLNSLGLLPEDSSVECAVSKRASFSEVLPDSVTSRHLSKLVSGFEHFVEAPRPVRKTAQG